MAEQKSDIPSFLMEGTQRTRGRDAQRINIIVALTIAESVKTTLGPMGMDKMLVDSLGDLVVTNDGATILREVDVDHPIAKMMVEVAQTQEAAVGDGTTTAVVLAGEFLKEGGKLLDQGIHPTVISRGFRLAAEKSQEILDSLITEISVEDDEVLRKIAVTAMTGKVAERAKDHLSSIVVKAAKAVAEDDGGGRLVINPENIKLERKDGAGIEATEFISGIALDKERVHPAMPSRVEQAKILLLNFPLELKEKEGEIHLPITCSTTPGLRAVRSGSGRRCRPSRPPGHPPSSLSGISMISPSSTSPRKESLRSAGCAGRIWRSWPGPRGHRL